ncbi:uncharacterized protein LOC135700772 [Ochlerotatus camptorhynchus]|uniref:uncharacterized protein LOC135700772 n=1 Tax=Ochlerotatus camptorhynchus TaxID=644619 RepID=UPI0031E0085C
MWSRRKRNPKHQIDSETLTEGPRKIRFNLFHRPKAIIGQTKPVVDGGKGQRPFSKNQPKVNLFPQVSLTDLGGEDLNNVLEYMYSSDWKEASAYCAHASYINLGDCGRTAAVSRDDITKQFPDRFRKQSHKARHLDLPRSEVDLVKWYKSFV